MIARTLGTVRFGLLGVGWALLEYFALFDIGLGRATTRFVAERLAAHDPLLLSEGVSLSLLLQALFGAVGGVALAAAAPALANHVFDAPPALAAEAIASFRVLALCLPLVMLALSLRGLLEGAQRFALSTAIRIPASASSFVIPAVAAALGASLPQILLALCVARAILCVVLVVAVRRAVPGLRWTLPRHWGVLRPLLSFGGWVAVSNVVSPLLVYIDRFVLGAVVGLAAVGYYTAPYEGAYRMLLVPSALVTALFPEITAAATRGQHARIARLYTSGCRLLVLALAPASAIALAFAPDLLHLWLGPAYAAASSTALRILAIGVLVNAVAHVPYIVLHAYGRSDVTAKFHLGELVVHLPLTWMLVRWLGISGAALAWSIRVAIDLVLLVYAARRVIGETAAERAPATTRSWVLPGGALLCGALIALMASTPIALRGGIAAVGLAAYAWFAWTALEQAERDTLRDLLVRARLWRVQPDAPAV